MTSETQAKIRAALAASWSWLRAHPRVYAAAIWFGIGFVIGLMVGCATPEHIYWCLRSSPGAGGPFCP